MVLGLLSVFGIAFFSFIWAIPTGVVLLHIPALWTIASACISYTVGVALVIIIGEPLRNWLMKRAGKRVDALLNNPNSAFMRIWNRYGIIGLGLAAPMTVGAQIGAVVAVSLGAPPRKLLLWMCIGALVWASLIAGGISLGLVTIQPPR